MSLMVWQGIAWLKASKASLRGKTVSFDEAISGISIIS
ncbi:hypothetical protein RFEPED_1415 [Rickettsia felis str. Pedreira]|uniref:Uncharacterized protein n=1 Tax=Rickettsia felis str. Pedreira TaxID=1359196 RepID=A0A0F3MTE6_RICFI|nr:hypothetical protein RFEPED_1415 [Rickettsia felis str. Pedreira]